MSGEKDKSSSSPAHQYESDTTDCSSISFTPQIMMVHSVHSSVIKYDQHIQTINLDTLFFVMKKKILKNCFYYFGGIECFFKLDNLKANAKIFSKLEYFIRIIIIRRTHLVVSQLPSSQIICSAGLERIRQNYLTQL